MHNFVRSNKYAIVVRNPMFMAKPNLNPIIEQDLMYGQYPIFLKQRYKSETKSDPKPNPKPMRNQ